MQERQLFQGVIQAGGIYLLVKGTYMYSLYGFDILAEPGYTYHNWMTPSLLIIMGILLLVGSVAITRFAYGSNYDPWSLASILQVGIKLLGGWLIYQQLGILANLLDTWKMNLLPGMAPSIGIPYWAIQMVVGMVLIAVGLFLLRYQPKLAANRGGV